MKSFFKISVLVLALVSLSFLLFSCSGDGNLNEGECVHNWSTVTTAPTCQSDGFDTKTCTLCGEEEICNEVSSLPHTYSEEYISDDSYHWHECSDCGDFDSQQEHNLDENNVCTVCAKFVFTKDINYEVSEDGTYAIVFSYSGDDTRIFIAETYNGLPVKKIEEYAFRGYANITSVVIPESVVYIGNEAFYNCENLSSVNIPDNVAFIGEKAFSGCDSSIYSYYMSGKYLSTSDNQYKVLIDITDKEITGYTLHEQTEIIARYTFANCLELRAVSIPASVTLISSQAFAHVPILSINVSESNTAYKDISGNLYTKDGKTLIQYATGKTSESFTVPASVEVIAKEAFAYCTALERVTIADSVTSIEDSAFYRCSALKNVLFGESLEIIGAFAFSWCYSLDRVLLFSRIREIGDHAFDACFELESVSIGALVVKIGEGAFDGCESLENITVSENNTAYKDVDGNLYTKDGKVLLQYADGKKDATFSVPDGVELISDYAVSDADNLECVIISDSVTTIGFGAFNGNGKLKSVVLGKSITTIKSNAFDACYALESVTLGSGAPMIEDYAFYLYSNCSNPVLYSVYENARYIGDADNPYAILIEVTSTELDSYIIHENTKVIASAAFSQCKNLKSVIIPDGVRVIGNGAFSGCVNLSSVTVADSVTRIGSSAFSGCSFSEISLPDGLTELGESAFGMCTALTEIVIPDGIKVINTFTFYNCESLVKVTVGRGVTLIDKSAFQGPPLTDVYYRGSEEDFAKIEIETANATFVEAAKHYNYTK